MDPRPLSRRRLLTATVAAALAAAALLAGCSPPQSPGAPTAPGPSSTASASTPAVSTSSNDGVIRVGSTNFTENRLLAEIYATALQHNGIHVERRFGVGPRELAMPALQDGSIDLMPEYTGNLLRYWKPQATATDARNIDPQLPGVLPAWLRVLNPAAAEDKDSVVVTTDYANTNQLHTIADLTALCPGIAFGAADEFKHRPDGTQGLLQAYGCKFKEFHPLDAGGPQTVAALRSGNVQAADLFSTDPSITADQFTVLQDPKQDFAAQNVIPLITTAKAGDPTVTAVLNAISAKLDTPTLTRLNGLVAGHADPAQVSLDWLRSVGIIH